MAATSLWPTPTAHVSRHGCPAPSDVEERGPPAGGMRYSGKGRAGKRRKSRRKRLALNGSALFTRFRQRFGPRGKQGGYDEYTKRYPAPPLQTAAAGL
ncbi:hypothetical protein ACLOJK_010296 [Asimina triloba]